MNAERMENLIRLGKMRLERARGGDDFFQFRPKEVCRGDAVEWYLRNFGRVINSDCAKFAFVGDGYVPSIAESVAKFHDAASKIVQDVVARMLDEVNEDSIVVFMAGGNGAGKSTFCDGARTGLGENDWIIDATLASYDSAATTMRQLTGRGVKTVLVFIDRPMDEAWENGVIKRARNGSHRTPRSVFESTHRIVSSNVERFRFEFVNGLGCYSHIVN